MPTDASGLSGADARSNPIRRLEAPVATYRLQLHAGFSFDDAAGVVPYLRALGISHVYTSPILQAAPGSTHGYDVVDHSRVNDELGGIDGYRRFGEALAAHGLGHVLDIVPNHMAISGPENRWWWDVLENGPSSRFAAFFDVDWDPPESKLRSTVLLPILGDHYGRVLEAGELRLERDGPRLTIRYHDRVLPVAPRSLSSLLRDAAERSSSAPPASGPLWPERLAFVADALGDLPLATATDPVSVHRRHRDKEALLEILAEACRSDADANAAVDEAVAAVNADVDALDALLERQNYRLARWRAGDREMVYRRFFDIDSLVGLRVEDEAVFTATHSLIVDLLRDGRVDGLRVDHVDGLRDPAAYLQRLRDAAPDAWIVVEKIVERGEELPDSWSVAGTTGYEFLNRVLGLFVDPAAVRLFEQLHAELTGTESSWAQTVHDAKHQLMRSALAADVTRLTAQLVKVCERHRRVRDYTRHELHEALREVMASLDVYRTYVRGADGGAVRDADVERISDAVEKAQRERPDLDPDLFVFLRDLLALRLPAHAGNAAYPEQPGDPEDTDFVERFQQLTGPVMAKGVEDTAFYRWVPLAALNEVGGDPSAFGGGVDAFHDACAATQARWPHTMLATSTHDTKRGEDVRARLVLLSQIPDRWRETVTRWRVRNDKYRTGDWPDAATEYVLYQTLVGAHPLSTDRALAYMAKATREAKVHTSWTDPVPEYDAAVRGFVEALCEDTQFQRELEEFVAPLVEPGRVTSLAQTLLKLTTPGVPDVYQGSDLWDLTLVDPDNRRPVDFGARATLLRELDSLSPKEILARMDEGAPKLWTIRQTLRVRRDHPAAFGAGPTGRFAPLATSGVHADRVVAFTRGDDVATVVPRLVFGLHDWGETAVVLPPGAWDDVLGGGATDGGSCPVGSLLAEFPVALLVRRP